MQYQGSARLAPVDIKDLISLNDLDLPFFIPRETDEGIMFVTLCDGVWDSGTKYRKKHHDKTIGILLKSKNTDNGKILFKEEFCTAYPILQQGFVKLYKQTGEFFFSFANREQIPNNRYKYKDYVNNISDIRYADLQNWQYNSDPLNDRNTDNANQANDSQKNQLAWVEQRLSQKETTDYKGHLHAFISQEIKPADEKPKQQPLPQGKVAKQAQPNVVPQQPPLPKEKSTKLPQPNVVPKQPPLPKGLEDGQVQANVPKVTPTTEESKRHLHKTKTIHPSKNTNPDERDERGFGISHCLIVLAVEAGIYQALFNVLRRKDARRILSLAIYLLISKDDKYEYFDDWTYKYFPIHTGSLSVMTIGKMMGYFERHHEVMDSYNSNVNELVATKFNNADGESNGQTKFIVTYPDNPDFVTLVKRHLLQVLQIRSQEALHSSEASLFSTELKNALASPEYGILLLEDIRAIRKDNNYEVLAVSDNQKCYLDALDVTLNGIINWEEKFFYFC